ncbi:hypothetical protein CDAR_552581, partial [Caerostris darwini]
NRVIWFPSCVSPRHRDIEEGYYLNTKYGWPLTAPKGSSDSLPPLNEDACKQEEGTNIVYRPSYQLNPNIWIFQL